MEGKTISYKRNDESYDKEIDKTGLSTEKNKEELFFDGEKYYTKEEFFNPDEEEENQKPKRKRKGIKIFIASLVAVALLSNVFAIWPRLFNLPAIEFLATSQELSKNEEVQSYKESIVVVRAGNSKGTGFYISEEGFVMTNEHVVGNDPQPTVSFQNGDHHVAEVIETDDQLDVAILQIDTEEEINYPALEFENNWEMDSSVYVIGNPLFFNYIANEGVIIGTTSTQSREEPVLMLDAPIYQGSSGSPVINNEGKVVGMVYATMRMDYEGTNTKVGLAIPVNSMEEYISN
ncbi:S1 family peptidase [Salipaludibacillus aurantiacus]|uniref:Serine protease Do n=1 Tax=Salipaludibacillus aurantiacus TaxID=1601833 RepID=A0A1H9XA52_9BACI|nr:serine protease [Salipaludibacillus aurantiacus]SES43015.1 serine protease Do [Salipaludibacillus aurantiacus]